MVAPLAAIALFVPTGISTAQVRVQDWSKEELALESCSSEFWNRATRVASGHGYRLELEARQIGRNRCDCVYVQGKPKACTASVVSKDEAVLPEPNE
jgi:hypothetical protein